MLCLIGIFLLYSICGTLLHFTFKLSNNNVVVGIISSVNESVWEHIKLLLTPIFMVSFINKNYNFFILLIELISAIVLIIIFYEIKEKLFKNKYGFINIFSFYIVCFIVSFEKCSLFNNFKIPFWLNNISLIIVITVFIMYLTFTIFPPKNKYFIDPITKKYGLDSYVNKSV